MDWLLTNERVKSVLRRCGMPEDIIESCGIYKYHEMAKAQLHDTTVKLMEPCTEHPRQARRILAVGFPESQYEITTTYAKYRKDCPACMEQLKQEAGIE